MYGRVFGYYPLGFRRQLQPGERKLDKDPDTQVADIYVKWQLDRASFSSWSKHEPTIRLAIEYFGDFRRWLIDQQDNPELGPHGWNFLLETINFINTGERHINVITQTSMVLVDSVEFNRLPVRDRRQNLASLLTCSSDMVYCQWLRHPGGFSDMVCSLNAFFGNTQPTGTVSWAS